MAGNWIDTRPSSEDKWSSVPGILQGNWAAYEGATSAEHGPLGTAASGSHGLCGIAGTCFYGTSTDKGNLVPTSGSLAYDQTQGYLQRYWSGAWADTTAAGWSRARWYALNNQSVTGADSSPQTVGLSFTGRSYDSFSEFNSGSSSFTTSAGGNYLIISQATINGSGTTPGVTTCATTVTNDIQRGFTVSPLTASPINPTGNTSVSWTPVGPSGTNWQIAAGLVGGGYLNAVGAVNDKYSITNPTFSGSISGASLTVSGQGYNSLGQGFVYFEILVGGVWYEQSVIFLNGVFSFSVSWATNPHSGNAWTQADLQGTGPDAWTGIGIRSDANFGNTYAYRLYGVVTYSYTNHYLLVREYPVGDDTTYVYAPCNTTTFPTDSFSASGGFSMQPVATNLSASVYIRASRSSTSVISAGSVLQMSNGVCYSGHSYSIPFCALSNTSWNTYRFIWNKNPVTNSSWTINQLTGGTAEILAGTALTGCGVYPSGTSSTTNIYVSQIYPAVDWSISTPTETLNVWKNYGMAGSAVIARGIKSSPEIGAARNDTVKAITISPLASGDSVCCYITKAVTNDTIMSGNDATYFTLHRMANTCL